MPSSTGGSGNSKPGRRNRRGRGASRRLHTVEETSAGGLIVNGEHTHAAIIGRLDRRGKLLWSLPKGHIEAGESAGQTAVREVREETGLRGEVLHPLGTIDYWFLTENRRVHKTVHHFLMQWRSGELSDEDVEVTEVAWVALGELGELLAYPDERKLVDEALTLLVEDQLGRPDTPDEQQERA